MCVCVCACACVRAGGCVRVCMCDSVCMCVSIYLLFLQANCKIKFITLNFLFGRSIICANLFY